MESRKVGVRKVSVEKKQFKTIVLVNLEDDLLERSLLQNHFSKFGEILKMHVSLKNKNAVISFSKASEAKAAKEQGGLILPNKPAVKMFYTEKGLEGGRSKPLMRSISAVKAPSQVPSASVSTAPAPHQPPSAGGAVKRKPMSVAKVTPSHSSTQQGESNRDQHSFYPDTPEAQELFAKRATTAEERYRLLEARDKMIRARNPKVKMRVEFAVKLSGTCPDMCPEKERYMREVQRQLTSYEMTGGRDSEVDHRLAVKAYARSSADQEEPLSHELRPSETLEMSLSYILHNIVPRMEHDDLPNWYNFVWDRTRSIRKEITQQQLCDLRSVAMMEKCARFHIYCSSRLCELDRHAFDMKLNDENLMKCLQSLEHMYTDLNLIGQACPNEPEFRAYQILMNLNEGDILWEIQQKPDWVRTSSHVHNAVRIHMAMFEKNYAQFFKLVRNAPYLTACILHRYFFQVRSTALRTIFKAYSIHNKSENYTSLTAVQRVLGFAEDKPNLFQYFCSSHGVSCDFDKGRITLSRKTFDMPDCPSITREYYLIESKLDQPINVILNGGPLGSNPYPHHSPHTSFNEHGYLIPGDLIGVPENKRQQQPQQTKPPPTTTSAAFPASSSSLSHFKWTLPTPAVVSSAPVVSTATPFPAPLPVAPPVAPFPFKPFPATSDVGVRGGAMSAATFVKPVPVFGALPPQRPSPPAHAPPSLPVPASLPPSMSGSSTSIFGGSFRATSFPSNFGQESGPVADASATLASQRQAEMERHAKVERERLVEKTAHRIYSQLVQQEIENLLRRLVVRRRQLQLVLNRKSERLTEKLVDDVVSDAIAKLSHASFNQQLKERERKLERLDELMKRIALRRWLGKWRKFAETQKRERELRLEEKWKELENFPSYQNTHLASSEEMLMSWCGGLEEIPRVTSPVSPKPSSATYPRPHVPQLPSHHQHLPANEAAEEADVEQFQRLVRLVDFPASSNLSQACPAAILSSWCRLQLDQQTSASPDLLPPERDTKKPRLDFYSSEFVESSS